jgi:hypothetical protein
LHGQHDERALVDPAAHRDLLDSFGGHARRLPPQARRGGSGVMPSRSLPATGQRLKLPRARATICVLRSRN